MKRYRIQVTANTDFGWVTLYNDSFEALNTPFPKVWVDKPFLSFLHAAFPTTESEWELNDGSDTFDTEWCVYVSPDVEASAGDAYLQAVLSID